MKLLLKFLSITMGTSLVVTPVISCKYYTNFGQIPHYITQDRFKSFKIDTFLIKGNPFKIITNTLKEEIHSLLPHSLNSESYYEVSIFVDKNKTLMTENNIKPVQTLYFICKANGNNSELTGETDLISFHLVYNDIRQDLSNIKNDNFNNGVFNIDISKPQTINEFEINDILWKFFWHKFKNINNLEELDFLIYKDKTKSELFKELPNDFNGSNFSLYLQISPKLGATHFKNQSELIECKFAIIKKFNFINMADKYNKHKIFNKLYKKDFKVYSVEAAKENIYKFLVYYGFINCLSNSFQYDRDFIFNLYSDKNKTVLKDSDIHANSIIYFQLISKNYKSINQTPLLFIPILDNKNQEFLNILDKQTFNNIAFLKNLLKTNGVQNLKNVIFDYEFIDDYKNDLIINLYKTKSSNNQVELTDNDLLHIYQSKLKSFSFNLEISAIPNSKHFCGTTGLIIGINCKLKSDEY